MPEHQYRLTNLGHAIIDVQQQFRELDPNLVKERVGVAQLAALEKGLPGITLRTAGHLADLAGLQLVVSFVAKRQSRRSKK